MFINEHGQKVYQGQEALDEGLRRLREHRKLHYRTSFQNIPISVENRRGSVRRGTDSDGSEWKTKMKQPYGYIPGTKGVDGDALDVFVGGSKHAPFAYIVHCNDKESGDFDEDKVMLGFRDAEAAKNCFMAHYDEPSFFGGMDKIPMWQFREKIWVKKHTTKKLIASMRESLQGMQRSMLGHHQDIMTNPNVREHGVKGMTWGDKKKIIEQNGGKYIGDMQHPKGGHIMLFNDPKTGGTLALHEDDVTPEGVKQKLSSHRKDMKVGEAQEFGVKGMHWGGKPVTQMTDEEWEKQKHREFLHDTARALQDKFDSMDKKKKEAGVKGMKWHVLHQDGIKLLKNPDAPDGQRFKVVAKKGEKVRIEREAQEHGVKGMKWGVRHQRHDAAGQKGSSIKNQRRSLANDPRTMNMMQHTSLANKTLQQVPKTNNPKQDHVQALDALKELGWKVAGSVASLTGLGSAFQAIQTVVKSPAGQKLFLNTDAQGGGHSISSDRKGRRQVRASMRESGFEERLGRFLREAKRKPRVYYARSLQRYGTAAEAGEKDLLKEYYPDSRVVFPRTARHADLGMEYFHDQIDEADEMVITPLRKNRVTAGVFSEAQHALHKGIPVRVLRKGKLRTVKGLRMIKGGKPGGEYARFILNTKSARKRKK